MWYGQVGAATGDEMRLGRKKLILLTGPREGALHAT